MHRPSERRNGERLQREKHWWLPAAAAALVIAAAGCAHYPEVSSIAVGSVRPTIGTVFPTIDSLLPPSARHDSAAIVAYVVDTKGGKSIQAQIAVVLDGTPDPDTFSREWTSVWPDSVFVKRILPGRYRITARRIGYHYATTVIDLHAGAIDTLLVRLHPDPLTLD